MSDIVNITRNNNDIISNYTANPQDEGADEGIAALVASLAQITSLKTSNYAFKNTSGDADLFKSVIETVNASTLYIDTNIYIDKPIIIDGTITKVKRIIGFGGTITFTNKGVSGIPCIQISNATDLLISDLEFQGDFNASLINETDWSNNIVSPLYLYQCQNVRVHNNTFRSILSAYTVCIRYCTNVVVSQNTILDCWRRNAGDTQGDAVYIGFTDGSKVINNYIKNNFTSKDNIGRIGVTYEFNTTKNFICSHNYIYGYDRSIHCENIGGKGLISHNIVEGCAMAYVGWQCGNYPVIIEYNHFSNTGIPTDHYTNIGQGAWGFISMYSNTPTVEVNANTIFRNNTFTLDANVNNMNYFISTKITGEFYYDNTFVDNNSNKSLFLYNPTDTGTINNNRLEFIGNKVQATNVYFGHIGKFKINGNIFNVTIFTFNCVPTPTLNFISREFIGNTIKNGDSGTVSTGAYLFMNKVSMLCKDNIFKDILIYSGEQNTLVRANQDYTSLPELKSIFDNNTVISIQSGTVSNVFLGRMDNMMHKTTSNKAITSSGTMYQSSGIANKSLLVVASDGGERAITVDTNGVLSTQAVQRWI